MGFDCAGAGDADFYRDCVGVRGTGRCGCRGPEAGTSYLVAHFDYGVGGVGSWTGDCLDWKKEEGSVGEGEKWEGSREMEARGQEDGEGDEFVEGARGTAEREFEGCELGG